MSYPAMRLKPGLIPRFFPIVLAAALAACSDRPAQTATQPSTPPAAAPVALQVQSWGPSETKRGAAVNRQADGASAIWIRVGGVTADPVTRVTFGAQNASAATVTPDLVTAAVPRAVIDNAGEYPVVIEEPNGRRTTVGTFKVTP